MLHFQPGRKIGVGSAQGLQRGFDLVLLRLAKGDDAEAFPRVTTEQLAHELGDVGSFCGVALVLIHAVFQPVKTDGAVEQRIGVCRGCLWIHHEQFRLRRAGKLAVGHRERRAPMRPLPARADTPANAAAPAAAIPTPPRQPARLARENG